MLSSSIIPLPPRPVTAVAIPHPSRLAASATPKTSRPDHFGAEFPDCGIDRAPKPCLLLVLVLAVLRARTDVIGSADNDCALFPLRIARPRVLYPRGGNAALQIELADMQVTRCDAVPGYHVLDI